MFQPSMVNWGSGIALGACSTIARPPRSVLGSLRAALRSQPMFLGNHTEGNRYLRKLLAARALQPELF